MAGLESFATGSNVKKIIKKLIIAYQIINNSDKENLKSKIKVSNIKIL